MAGVRCLKQLKQTELEPGSIDVDHEQISHGWLDIDFAAAKD